MQASIPRTNLSRLAKKQEAGIEVTNLSAHHRGLRYHLVILCLWQEHGAADKDCLVWRYSLENPRTAERHGFHDLGALAAFLSQWTSEPAAEEAPGEAGTVKQNESHQTSNLLKYSQ